MSHDGFLWGTDNLCFSYTYIKQNVKISNRAGVLNHITSFLRYKFRSFPEKLYNSGFVITGLNAQTSEMEKQEGKIPTD